MSLEQPIPINRKLQKSTLLEKEPRSVLRANSPQVKLNSDPEKFYKKTADVDLPKLQKTNPLLSELIHRSRTQQQREAMKKGKPFLRQIK